MAKKPRLDLRRFVENPAEFRSALWVNSANGPPGLFNPDPWQAAELSEIDKLWKRSLGMLEDGGPKNAYIGRARGHSKTTDEAIEILWGLAFAPKKIRGIAAAASREQAQILKDQAETLVMLNDWLAKVIDIQNFVIRNTMTMSQLDIISSDVGSSFGLEADFIIADELTHWTKEKFWDSLTSTQAKRDNCAMVVLTNAGYMNTWQHRIFKKVQNSKKWLFIHHDGPKASWIKQETIEEQQRMISPKAYSRLWLNQWQLEGGDELSETDVLSSVKPDLRPMRGDEPGWTFVGGIDLSTKRHRSALVMLAANQEMQVVRLAGVLSFKPGPNGMVDLVELQATFRAWHKKFRPAVWCYDPHQAALLAQQAQVDGIFMREVAFGSKNLGLMASTILQIFRSRQIELYDDKDLVSDILKLRIVEKAFGMKLEAPEDESGHADRAFAMAVALPAAVEYASIVPMNVFVDRKMIYTMDELESKLEPPQGDKECRKIPQAGPDFQNLPSPGMGDIMRDVLPDPFHLEDDAA